ncbi:Tripartite ATP-independent transporter, DctQ component [Aliiroseovarius sediminilitoris]|uniref:TRAP transporter small permease protein n=1 Tax=Aliiroseovarius sediminilitoris TaxID=1173584 RepID=A0A1I0PDV0_9RHOB|nr:TRAP transporter small permease subunit [Aliiroseovarius sediminilitoris]SEW12465.1 Tripartite ATP-independent transporter, DctQ component [Aliiroseovarius sediminilitoris]
MERLKSAMMKALAIALIAMMSGIVVQVVFSTFDINPILSFMRAVPLLGKAITLNSLLDIQWHLLVIIGLIPAGLVWQANKHVRVDFLYQNRSNRTKARIDLVGNLIFAVPFFALGLPAAWSFMMRAWASDEGGRNGGLNDLWLIKAVLPLGLTLLAVAILIETIRLIRASR